MWQTGSVRRHVGRCEIMRQRVLRHLAETGARWRQCHLTETYNAIWRSVWELHFKGEKFAGTVKMSFYRFSQFTGRIARASQQYAYSPQVNITLTHKSHNSLWHYGASNLLLSDNEYFWGWLLNSWTWAVVMVFSTTPFYKPSLLL